MRCLEWQEWMSLKLDGRLPAEQQRRLALHLDDCLACRQVWQHWQELDSLFSGATLAQPPEDLAARVMARIERRPRPTALGGSLVVLAVGLAALATVLILPLVARLCLMSTTTTDPAGALPVLVAAAASLWEVVRMAAEAARLFLWAGLSSRTLVAALAYVGVALAAVAVWLRVAVFPKAQGVAWPSGR
jgi:predicted anti-sigma-YlaC factor YlaD